MLRVQWIWIHWTQIAAFIVLEGDREREMNEGVFELSQGLQSMHLN